jgi:hypothetical protein
MMKPLHGILMTCLVVTLTALGGSAQASAPLSKAQTPGWYRIMLGDFEVTMRQALTALDSAQRNK